MRILIFKEQTLMIGFADEVQWKMQLLKRGNSPNKTSQVSFVLADIIQINSK